MTVSATNTYTAKGQAEQFSEVIVNVSPQDTPLYTLAKKKTGNAKLYQWQV